MNIIWARSIVSIVLLAVLCALLGVFVNVRTALIVAILVLLIVAVFGWAVNAGQLDGFENEAERILLDEDQPA